VCTIQYNGQITIEFIQNIFFFDHIELAENAFFISATDAVCSGVCWIERDIYGRKYCLLDIADFGSTLGVM